MNDITNVWPEVRVVSSKDCNVKKFVFNKQIGKPAVVEAVLYKYPTYNDRTVVCCSTQSGCPIGCRFCGTGDYFVRSLSAEEIVSQTDFLFEHEKIETSNVKRLQIMFMSMGEPLLNLNNLEKAIEVLNQKHPNAALLISTSAPKVDYAKVREFSKRISTVGLQFSVHESTNEARNALVPFKSKLTLEEIGREGELWFEATGRQPFFNYCAHDKNTAWEDVERLNKLFNARIWQATISVICEQDESVAAANERQRSLADNFQDKLMQVGYSTRTFDPAGQDDIGGGCGQLWFVQDWMRNNPQFAKPSAGNGLVKIHTPRQIQNAEKIAA